MAVRFNEQKKIITLHTAHTTYQMQIDAYGFLLHLYYGTRMNGEADYLLTHADRGFSGNPYDAAADRTYSMDTLPQEFPIWGTGDFRSCALVVENGDGTSACDLRYVSHCIREGKYTLPGLPALYAEEGECAQTLEILLEDRGTGVQAVLLYGILEEKDVITRSVIIQNKGKSAVTVQKVSSVCLDFLYGEYDLLYFYGRHAMERNLQRIPVSHGSHVIGSKRGTSSHQYNPFMIAAEKGTTEDFGNCYGLSFVYSGNFKGEAEQDQINQTRVLLGLQDELFAKVLNPGEQFQAPEAVMSYAAGGLTELSDRYHRAYRRNLCRGKYKLLPRPVLINNWEATYFDFNGEKIFQIARQAAELGVEMLVLDDGWFGKRDDDNTGLGDWVVNETKMQGTIHDLAERINGLGMKFGIWVEPEMVSEDSDLYREHPDWAFVIPGRKPVKGRNQLVLDFSRKEVRNHVFEQIAEVLDSANIEYIKWDMNRSITDVYSAPADKENQGSVLHEYLLGVYEILERIGERYPDLFIEGCSGGGGRFDAGMLYYTPQIWCSDNTDAIDRIRIQYGTSFGYPVSAVGSHVSASPNHQTGRSTSIHTRGVVAMAGSFGYELDLERISQEEKEAVKKQIQDFHRYWELIHNGSYYRLTDPFGTEEKAAWEFVSEDRQEMLLNLVTLNRHGNHPAEYIRLKGLEPEADYCLEGDEKRYKGSLLMNGGFPIPLEMKEYDALQLHFVKK